LNKRFRKYYRFSSESLSEQWLSCSKPGAGILKNSIKEIIKNLKDYLGAGEIRITIKD